MENHKTNEFGFYFDLLSRAVLYADIIMEVCQEVAPAYKDFSEGKDSSKNMVQVHRVINKILFLKTIDNTEKEKNRLIFMEVAHRLSGCDWLEIKKSEKAAIDLMLEKLVIKNLDNVIDVLTTAIGTMKDTPVGVRCYVYSVSQFSNLVKMSSLLINELKAGKLNMEAVGSFYTAFRVIILNILVAAESPKIKAIV